MGELLAATCGATAFLSVPFLFGAYLRYMRYRETIALAERGFYAPRRRGAGEDTLRWGIAITFIGLALCIGLYPLGWSAAPGMFPLNFGPWMLIGLVPLAFGLALIVIYVATRKKNDEPTETPPTEEAS